MVARHGPGACRIRANARAGNPVRRAMEGRGRRGLDAGMHKKPSLPPHHRAYPRTHPIPVRAGAAPRPEATPNGAATWSRTVPVGRRFPRGGP